MIRNRRKGQAFVLVLILLAVGALMIIPVLQLSSISLRNSRKISEFNTGLYACAAAQEKIMWMLYHGTLVDELNTPDSTANFTVDVCGTTVVCSVVMRAVELTGGVILATEHTIMPTKTVEPSTVPNGDPGPYVYTIAMEQVSSNSTSKLEAVYDVLPPTFTKQCGDVYQTGSSEISIDGVNWSYIEDPLCEEYAQQVRLRWPASGNFTDTSFKEFEPGEVHYLRFTVKKGVTDNNEVACNWVVLQVGDVLTASGPQAPLVVGEPEDPDACENDGLFDVWKTSEPATIPPLVATNVTYTVHITNMTNSSRFVGSIIDILPPGFTYIEEDAITFINGVEDIIAPGYTGNGTFNGIPRKYIYWNNDQLGASGLHLPAGDNATITFRALATQSISGTYYNEITVSPNNIPQSYAIFTDIGLSIPDIGDTYSWNSGTVIVPAYDSSTGAEGENVTSNMAIAPGGVIIVSWNTQ